MTAGAHAHACKQTHLGGVAQQAQVSTQRVQLQVPQHHHAVTRQLRRQAGCTGGAQVRGQAWPTAASTHACRRGHRAPCMEPRAAAQRHSLPCCCRRSVQSAVQVGMQAEELACARMRAPSPPLAAATPRGSAMCHAVRLMITPAQVCTAVSQQHAAAHMHAHAWCTHACGAHLLNISLHVDQLHASGVDEDVRVGCLAGLRARRRTAAQHALHACGAKLRLALIHPCPTAGWLMLGARVTIQRCCACAPLHATCVNTSRVGVGGGLME